MWGSGLQLAFPLVKRSEGRAAEPSLRGPADRREFPEEVNESAKGWFAKSLNWLAQNSEDSE